MVETRLVACALFAGIASAIVFFGALWWTIREGLSRRDLRLFRASFLFRMGILLALSWWSCGSSPQAWTAWFLGLLATRAVIVRMAFSPVRFIPGSGSPLRPDSSKG